MTTNGADNKPGDTLVSDNSSQTRSQADERELVSALLYLDVYSSQSREQPAVAQSDTTTFKGLDGKPITDLSSVDPRKPILAESVNRNGQREIKAYSTRADLEAGEPAARLLLESSQSGGSTVEKGTIFRGKTDEILTTRSITQDSSNFDLTFQVDANGETQLISFDGSGLPRKFELTREGRTVEFKFDEKGNVVDCSDSQNPDQPVKEPFRTMFILAAKQSLDELRSNQGLPAPWVGADGDLSGENGGKALFERAFVRGGLPAVLQDARGMTPEQSKQVLKLAVEQLPDSRPREGALSREQADAVVELTSRVYDELGRDSEPAIALRKELYELYKPNPASKQTLADAFIRYSRTDQNRGAQLFLTALRSFELDKQAPDALVENLPHILKRFTDSADVKEILQSGSLENLAKNYPGTKDIVADWLDGLAKSDNPEVRESVLTFVSKNGLEHFGDKAITRDRLIQSAFEDLGSDNATTSKTAHEALSRLAETDPRSAEKIVSRLKQLEPTQLIGALGENFEFNELIQKELCTRASDPEQKKIIEGLLLDHLKLNAGKPSTEVTFATLGRILLQSPEQDPRPGETVDALIELTRKGGTNRDKAFDAILATALTPTEEGSISSQCGEGLFHVQTNDQRKEAIKNALDRFDLNTAEGVASLARVPKTYFGEQVDARLRGVLERNDQSIAGKEKGEPELFKAALNGLFLQNSSSQLLRSLAKPGESDATVLERLVPHLSAENQNQLREQFKRTIFDRYSSAAEKVSATELLCALGTSGLDEKGVADYSKELNSTFDWLLRQNLPADEVQRLGRVGDTSMGKLLRSGNEQDQKEAISWFERRAKAGADLPAEVIDKALELVDKPEFASSAAGLLSAVSGKSGDVAQSERINKRLVEAAIGNDSVVRELVSTLGWQGVGSYAALDVLTQLTSQRPEKVPVVVDTIVDRLNRGGNSKLVDAIADLAEKNPNEVVKALTDIYNRDKDSSEPLRGLARLVESKNSTVGGAAKDELLRLVQSEANRQPVLTALKTQYLVSGSEALVGLVAGLFDNSMQFKPDSSQALADLSEKAKTNEPALDLLAFLAGGRGDAGREAAVLLQQLGKSNPEQFRRVYEGLRTYFNGTNSSQSLDSPAMSLYINMSRNRIHAPLVSGDLLKQDMLGLVDQIYRGDKNLPLDNYSRERLGAVLGGVAGSNSRNYWSQLNAFVQRFSPAALEQTPVPGQPVRVPEGGKQQEAPPREPFEKTDGTVSTPIWEGAVFKGYSEVAPDKTLVTRDSEGRITKVVSPKGVGREFVWGPQGFITKIRESSGVEFSSADGINYVMRPASPVSPVLSGELTIEPDGAYSVKGEEGTIRRGIDGRISVEDTSGRLLQQLQPNGSSIRYNEQGQIVETASSSGQVRKFKYSTALDKTPSEVTEPNGDVFTRQPDGTWKQVDGELTRTGGYSFSDTGALVFKRDDGVKIIENLDGSHVELDAKSRPTVVLTPDGRKREMQYSGDETEPSRITFSDKSGGTSWTRTATGARPSGDSWKNDQTGQTWTETISIKPDGTIARTGGPESGDREVLLRPDGWEVGSPRYSDPKLATKVNPDGSKVLMNEAGQVVGLELANGRQSISIGYTDGFISSVYDGNQRWETNDGRYWKGRDGTRAGFFNVYEDGTLKFVSDLTGAQIQHKTDGSVITRDSSGSITQLVTANDRTFRFEYPAGSDRPNAYINSEGRWVTTDGENWTLDGANPPRTTKFKLDLNQQEGSLIQTMSETGDRLVFLRTGHIHVVDKESRTTYNEYPNGIWNRTTYNEKGQRQRYEELLSSGAKLDTTFVTVDGKEKLQTLETTNRLRQKRTYQFDPQRTTPPDGQPLVTAYRDEQGRWWRRQESGGTGHVYKMDGSKEVSTGVVKINRQGEFAQINQDSIVEIKNNGLRIETTKEPHNTQKTYDARGLLVETVDYLGLRRRYSYDGRGNITRIKEFDGQQEKVFEANDKRDFWVWRDRYGNWKETRHGSYRLDQKNGQLTLEGPYTPARTEYLTRQPCVLDREQISQIAKDIHKFIEKGGNDAANAIKEMLDPLAWEQRAFIATEFMELYGDKYTGGLTEALKSAFRVDQVAVIDSALNRKNDDPNYAGLIRNTLVEYENGAWYNGTRTNYTCAKEIRDVLWRMNPEEFAKMDADYQKRYGKSVRDAILDKISEEPDRAAMILLLDGAVSGQVDHQKMIDLGMQERRIDLVRDALKDAPEEFRIKFLNDGGEQKINDTFGAGFWDYVKSIATLGIRDVYIRSRGYGIGSSRDVVDLTDHARYGVLSEATTVSDNTTWLGDNEEAIEHSLNNISDDRRQLYRMGLSMANGTSEESLVQEFPHLASLTPEARNFQIQNARKFYADLDAAMTKAAGWGSTTKMFELAKWRDLLLHPVVAGASGSGAEKAPEREPGTIVARLSIHAGNIYHSNANDIVSTIEKMSEGDWHYLHNLPEAEKQRILDEVEKMIGGIREEVKDDCLRMIREKMDAPTWEKAQATGRRDVLKVLEDNKYSVISKPENVLDALQHMTDAEKQRVRTDSTYRDELQSKLVKALSVSSEVNDQATALVGGVLDRIVSGGSSAFTPLDRARQGVLETLNAREMSKDSEHTVSPHDAQMKALRDIVSMFGKDSKLLSAYQKDPALQAELQKQLEQMSPGDKLKFVSPIMRMIREGGFPPEALKDFCGNDFQKLREFLPWLTPAARANLLSNESGFENAFAFLGDWQKESVIRNILKNDGVAKPEDIARAFVLKWGVDKGQLTQAFQSLDSVARDTAYNNYYQKYGGTLDADLRSEIGGAMTQRLLARNETPEMQMQRLLSQYYASSDGLGASFVQTMWDGTPAQARAQADRLIKMHADSNKMFENLKNDPKFKDAVKALDQAVQMMRESKAGAADALSTALITIGAIALSGVSGGASLIVLAAVLGAAVKVSVNMAVMGADSTAREHALSMILTGGLEGVLNVLGPGHVAKIFGMTSKTAGVVSASVGKKFAAQFGNHLLTDGAEAAMGRQLSKELGQAVATGSHHIPDKTLETIARQSLKPAEQTAHNIERMKLLLKAEIKDAMVDQVKLSVQNMMKEMGIHGLTGGGAGFAGVTGETAISMSTGDGKSWDPRMTFEQNMERYLKTAGTATLIGGFAGSGFHAATRTVRGAGTLLRSQRAAEFDGLEKLFRGQNPADQAPTVDKMLDWANRATGKEREKAFTRVRETLGISKQAWDTVATPTLGKANVTVAEIQDAVKLAQAVNKLDQRVVTAMNALPVESRVAAVGTLVRELEKANPEVRASVNKLLDNPQAVSDLGEKLQFIEAMSENAEFAKINPGLDVLLSPHVTSSSLADMKAILEMPAYKTAIANGDATTIGALRKIFESPNLIATLKTADHWSEKALKAINELSPDDLHGLEFRLAILPDTERSAAMRAFSEAPPDVRARFLGRVSDQQPSKGDGASSKGDTPSDGTGKKSKAGDEDSEGRDRDRVDEGDDAKGRPGDAPGLMTPAELKAFSDRIASKFSDQPITQQQFKELFEGDYVIDGVKRKLTPDEKKVVAEILEQSGPNMNNAQLNARMKSVQAAAEALEGWKWGSPQRREGPGVATIYVLDGASDANALSHLFKVNTGLDVHIKILSGKELSDLQQVAKKIGDMQDEIKMLTDEFGANLSTPFQGKKNYSVGDHIRSLQNKITAAKSRNNLENAIVFDNLASASPEQRRVLGLVDNLLVADMDGFTRGPNLYDLASAGLSGDTGVVRDKIQSLLGNITRAQKEKGLSLRDATNRVLRGEYADSVTSSFPGAHVHNTGATLPGRAGRDAANGASDNLQSSLFAETFKPPTTSRDVQDVLGKLSADRQRLAASLLEGGLEAHSYVDMLRQARDLYRNFLATVPGGDPKNLLIVTGFETGGSAYMINSLFARVNGLGPENFVSMNDLRALARIKDGSGIPKELEPLMAKLKGKRLAFVDDNAMSGTQVVNLLNQHHDILAAAQRTLKRSDSAVDGMSVGTFGRYKGESLPDPWQDFNNYPKILGDGTKPPEFPVTLVDSPSIYKPLPESDWFNKLTPDEQDLALGWLLERSQYGKSSVRSALCTPYGGPNNNILWIQAFLEHPDGLGLPMRKPCDWTEVLLGRASQPSYTKNK